MGKLPLLQTATHVVQFEAGKLFCSDLVITMVPSLSVILTAFPNILIITQGYKATTKPDAPLELFRSVCIDLLNLSRATLPACYLARAHRVLWSS